MTQDETTKIRTAKVDKQKDDEDGDRTQFELLRVHILGADGRPAFDKLGKEVTSCVCLPLGQKEVVRRREEAKGLPIRDVEMPLMRAFFEVEAESGIPVPSDFHIPPDVRKVVNWDEVKRAFSAKIPDDVIEDEAPEAALAGDEKAAAKAKANRERQRRFKLSAKLKTIRESLTKFDVLGFGEYSGAWWVWHTGKPLRDFPHTHVKAEASAAQDEGDPVDIPF